MSTLNDYLNKISNIIPSYNDKLLCIIMITIYIIVAYSYIGLYKCNTSTHNIKFKCNKIIDKESGNEISNGEYKYRLSPYYNITTGILSSTVIVLILINIHSIIYKDIQPWKIKFLISFIYIYTLYVIIFNKRCDNGNSDYIIECNGFKNEYNNRLYNSFIYIVSWLILIISFYLYIKLIIL